MSSKGKQLAKGQKQIYEENVSTIRFFTVMATASIIIHLSVVYIFFYENTSNYSWFMFAMSVMAQLGSLQFMRSMAKSIRSETGQIVDAGIDLNMEGGLGEYSKDIIILAAICQALSIFSVYFWLLSGTGPAFALYKLWTGILAPWIFAPSPEGDDNDEKAKKRAKKENKRVVVTRR